MTFDSDKKKTLERMEKDDRSRKGSVDENIKKLLDVINKNQDYYTTSSCSGRILVVSKSGRRAGTDWIYVTHDNAGSEKVMASLKRIPEETLWFKQESFIIHVVTRDFDSAEKLLKICRSVGLKRAGIISFGKKITIEIMNDTGFEVPISEKGKLIVSEPYIETVINLANHNMEKNLVKIKEFSANF